MRRHWLASMAMWLLCATPTQAQVVVLIHPDSADFIVVQNHPSSRTEAMRRAAAKKPLGGWRPLLESTVPGHGAMFCFLPKGSQARYFIAEGKATEPTAVINARAQANAAARGTGAFTAICGTWNNRNAYPLETQTPFPAAPQSAGTGPAIDQGVPRGEGERGLIDTIKRQVRERMACDPKQNDCPPPSKSTATGVRG